MSQRTHHTDLTYRADIDGLRAVAILAVLAFHAFPKAVPGGFYGVDAFFVISGYLIGGIILRQLEQGRFRFLDFYGRRIRRIFPALLVVLATTLVVGWFTLLPQEYVALGRHIAAAAAFASNFLLWTETGYFDPAIDTKPLMHLWSLGVEEQFYIVWPLLLLVATRMLRNALPLIAFLAVVSFGLMLATVNNDAAAAFYLPIFRFWELMLGSILAAMGTSSQGWSLSNAMTLRLTGHLREGIAVLGMGMLLVAMALPEAARTAMGFWALIPTLGCVFAIAAGPSTWVNRIILGNGVARRIGLISYPLYLWHWPLLSFAHIIQGPPILPAAGGTAGEHPSLSWQLGAVVASFVLATLTYLLVERPLRFGRHTRPKTIGLCLAMIAVGCMGYVVQLQDGFRQRMPEILRHGTTDFKTAWRYGRCHLDPIVGHLPYADECFDRSRRPSVVLWGDSLSAALYPGFKHYLEPLGYGLTQLSGCPPILGFDRLTWKQCPEMTESEIATIIELKPDILVLIANWPEARLDGLQETIERLRRNGVENIVLLGPMPYWRGSFPRVVLSYIVKHGGQIPPTRLPFGDVVINPALDSRVRDIAQATNIRFVSIYDALCNQDGCLTGIGDTKEDVMVFDRVHLTVEGSLFLVKRILDAVLGVRR